MTDTVTAAPEGVPANQTPAADPGPMNLDSFAQAITDASKPKEEPTAGQNRDPATGRFAPKAGEGEGAADPNAAAAEPTQTPESESAKPKGDATDADDIEITEDGTGETKPPSPVDAPASWPAELKPAFAKLDADSQRALAEWQSKRDRDIAAQVKEASEAKQKVEAEIEPERAKVRTHLEQLQQALQHYAVPKVVADYRKEFADVLSGKVTPLQLADPNGEHRYAEDGTDRLERYRAYQDQFAQMERTANLVQAEQAQQKKAEFEKFRTAETAKYRDEHKLGDEAAWEAHNDELTKIGESFGFKADELAYADARHMNVLRAAMEAGSGSKAEAEFTAFVKDLGLKDFAMKPMEAAKRYAKAVAAKQKAEASPNPKPVPKVAKPGVSQPQPGALDSKRAAFESETSKPIGLDDFAAALRKAS